MTSAIASFTATAAALPSADAVPAPAPAAATTGPRDAGRQAQQQSAVVQAESAPPPGLQSFDLRFRVDPDLHEVVVSMVDSDTGSVLRQIPSEDALKLAKALESIGKIFLQDRA